ncbi:hypothetical protein Pmar_PMAR026708 [Perkinsus marinus ATCC 50983]|uniref:Cysteine protease n=1 Tax=Perkinsus marinus (strain ATCC 50983 / TXsc) TaxID=423536 RepID=C5K5V7_PERM5|nr:hypothetical protein Pmar_PMAR026708 [Perkinsus marinus ATCC 50983]EER20118.1 hypothetical protein Pmar_PMAR026708 [Perkinsus marinus ATCC 50983]|eukprot:XP_002788322.1 hypothetical protein Pmar_PMAR026708 [Perkinsus marinus ATCC 50983]
MIGPARVCDVSITSSAHGPSGARCLCRPRWTAQTRGREGLSAGRRCSGSDHRLVTMEVVEMEVSPRASGAASPASSASGSSVNRRRRRSWSLGSRGHEWAVLSPSDASLTRSQTSEDISSPSHFVMVGFSAGPSAAHDGSDVSMPCREARNECPSVSSPTSLASVVDDIEDTSADEWSKGVLILFPVRLTDGDVVDADSARVVSDYLKLPWCVGVIGGQSTRAHYVVGVAEKDTYLQSSTWGRSGYRQTRTDLLSIDPHFVQSAVVEAQSISFKNSDEPSRLQPTKLNPSLGVGFYVKDETDLEELSAELDRVKGGFIQVCVPGSALGSFSAASAHISADRVIVL